MNKLKYVLGIAFCAGLTLGLNPSAEALGPCEKEAAHCNRQVDVEFRQEKKILGNTEARNRLDGRRYECRTALKKCHRLATDRRDLKLGYGAGYGYSGSGSSGSSSQY